MIICRQCGLAANYLTCMAKYGEPPAKPAYDVSTCNQGKCDVCLREDVAVISERDYFYPDFRLINKPAWRRAMREMK